ncbi:MAG: sugar transferase [Gammaproteobacteria bacterium]|nr:sugar transferase [Gammaproteobacteria bacterium]MCD8525520.1 sugar transferase [Gammaproteobacteria bacterium]MCD8542864.1 sugar transferase [Gammaproteobacteria bacterium]
MYNKFFKRSIDLFGAVFFLLLLSPLLLVVSLVLFFTMGSVFFVQERGGYQGKVFKIVKFKTMTDERDLYGNLLPDERRLTAVGNFVRKWSIDELLGLINVLRGDMSLIGPRPQLAEYLPRYTPEQYRRHEVMPGITGWAQVNGRNAISWHKKFELDVWYVDHLSFWLDMKIALMTVYKVLKKADINQEGYATVSAFQGVEN